ncbi:uncharacterized protein [Branchiostoma lanceolatum]|uniref:uncharacterized protein n=1 Tax=Branchiostoma lanceolatum TaxID=7740 RepID=UPI0034558CCC
MRDLFYITKKHCGLKWKDLGRSLGFEEAELEVVDAKHKDAGESCMEMLSTWWYRACREATPQTLLADALTNAGLKEVADLIEEYVSDRGSNNTDHDESCSTRRAPETPCNNNVFQHVANSIGDNWKVLARHLDGGVREAVLRGIEKQFDQNAKECCRHVLENWKQRNGRVATLETLRTLLRTAGLAEIADNIDDGDGFHLGDEGTKMKTEAGHDVGSPAAEISAKGLRKRFQTVADVIGDGWQQLALHLGKNDRQIRGIEHEHNGNTRECCLHVLDEWKLQRGNQVTAETLNEALRSTGLLDIVSSIQDDGPSGRHQSQHNQLLEDAKIVGKDSQRPSQEFTERDHRNVTMLFKRIPRQGTFGDRRLERVCSKVAIYMDNLKEQGDWNTYDRFVTKAFGLYEDKPDIMIRITLEDIAASYYRGDLARGDKRAHFAQDLLLKTQDPQHHQAHLMYLKSAILRRRKRYDEAEGAIILARQGLEFIQIGRDSGEIWYNVAALFAEVLNEKVVDQPDLWERDVVPSLQSAIDHYRRSLEKDDDDSCRNKLRRAHIRLSMALMHCWSQVSREKHVQQRAIPAVDLRRAENSLLEVENNLWEDISERMECSWLLAKSDLMCLRGSYRRASQLANNVLTIAQRASFPAETTFARDRLELLKQVTKTEVPRVLDEEDILRDLSICDDDAVKNLSAEKVLKSNTDPRSDTCAVIPEKEDGRETDVMQRRHGTNEQEVSSTFGDSYFYATSGKD